MASSQQHQQHSSSSRSYKHRRRLITVHVEPTLGGSFPISCSPYLTVDRFKEDISDRLGISPKKMSLLHRSTQLKTGTLNENGVQEGSQIKLVPCLESGVNTPLSMDPVSMMKHSMSNISDHQIDDFLAGKSPLSVAIRLGESVVVVNLNRAKVEEVEMESPPEKKRNSSSGTLCSHSSSSSTNTEQIETSTATNPTPSSEANNGLSSTELSPTATSLNTNPHWSSTTCATPTVTPTVTPTCGVPIRSAIPVGVPAPNNDGGAASSSLGGKNLATPTGLLIHETSALPSRRRTREMLDSTPSILPSSSLPSTSSPLVNTSPSCLSSSRPIKKATRRSNSSKNSSKTNSSSTSSSNSSSKLHLSQSEWEELRRLREIPLSQNGVSMKRKAVMEAIGEILKKMYAQRIKGKVPGTFKGRFSSEFTCDNDMQDIIHSRTTMTSYGEMMSRAGHLSATPSCFHDDGSGNMSQARFRENEELKDKMAMLKWRMQQQKAMRKRRRTAGATPSSSSAPSPAGAEWLEEEDIDCELPPPKLRKKTGFCGLKRGFLLAD